MKITILTIIIFNLLLLQPPITDDGWIDYLRLKSHYPNMSFHAYACLQYQCKISNVSLDDYAALVKAESRWIEVPLQVSVSGALGLGQIMPFNYPGPKEDLRFADVNFRVGVPYYAYCLRLAKGDKKEALRFYNAGPASKKSNYRNWGYVNAITYHSDAAQKNKERYYKIY
jgi:hypothetical protein